MGGPPCLKARLCGNRLKNSGENINLLTSSAEFEALDPSEVIACIKAIDVAEEAAREAEEYIAKVTGAVL